MVSELSESRSLIVGRSAGSTRVAPAPLQGGERLLEQRVGLHAVARVEGAEHADALPLEPVGIEELGVVGRELAGARRGLRVAGVDADQGAQHRRRVGHGAGVGADRVLGVGDGDDAGAAGQPHRGLDGGDAAVVRRADDRAVGLGAEAGGDEVGGHRRGRAGAGAARVAVEHVGVAGQPPLAAPAAGGVEAAEVRPLGEVGLAEDHRARRPQPRGHGGVLVRRSALQGERAGRRLHAVAGVDVPLQHHRDAVQGAAHVPLLALLVELAGDPAGVRVDLQDGVDPGAALVDRRDALEIAVDEVERGHAAPGHRGLQPGDGGLLQLDRRLAERRRRLGRLRRRDPNQPRQGDAGAGHGPQAQEVSPAHLSGSLGFPSPRLIMIFGHDDLLSNVERGGH